MLKYIFAALLILVVWGLWWFLELPLWVAILSTVVIILIIVTIVVWGVIKARRAANKIEKALASQGAAQAAGARPDMRADINAMSSEFDKAVGALKGSKLGKEALYALPWYVIIGPPGVGKSTALRNSGLQFPYLSDKGGGSVKGIGGTRNCDWWMTNQAVIVDTAGRYTTEDTDRDEWIAFLDLLKDTRPKRPINGILLAVSVPDLALANEDELNTMSSKIRARIDEVTKHLEMSVPVYVLFTKCDLLPGFVETYSEMGKSERKSIWGFTLPVTGAYAGVDPTGTFCDQFDRLADRTEQRAFRRMGEERRIESRGKIYELPQHFEMLRENLASFIGMVFTGNVYAETPMLRGCYFTSGTQEGRPIDRLMGNMAQAFGMQSALPGHAQVEARSYFLGNLFNKVIFADRELARRSAKHVRQSSIFKWAGAGGIFALALGLCVLPVRSMKANREVISELRGVVDGLEEGADDGMPVATVDRLYPLYTAQSQLHTFETDSAPFRLRWGMYQGDELMPPARALFGRNVREELVIPLMEAKHLDLKNFAARYPDDTDEPPTDESGEAFDMLRAYLLLSGDFRDYRSTNEISLEKLEAGRSRENVWVAEQLAKWWAEAMLIDKESETFARMNSVTSTYIEVLREQPSLELEDDAEMIEAVRKVLRRSDRTEAWLAELIEEAGDVDGVKDLTLASLKLGTKVYKNDNIRVRGAFTRQGWEKHCREELGKNQGDFAGSEWVLGLSSSEASQRRQADRLRLRSRYFDQYIKEWDQFIAKIYVDARSDLVGSLKMFQELARGGTALRLLLRKVNYHSKLDEIKGEDDGAPWYDPEQVSPQVKEMVRKGTAEGDKAFLENKDVRDYFRPFVAFGVDVSADDSDEEDAPPSGALTIDIYAEELTAVRDALQAAVDDRAELDPLAKRLRTATQTVKGQISEQQEPWRSRFDRILRPPFDAVRGVVEKGQGEGLGSSWCNSVYIPFDQQIANKYPFNPKGYDLPVAEFAAWFGPEQGPIWEFYNASLASRIQKNGSKFSIVDSGKANTITYNPQLPPFLTSVGDIGSAVFPPGSAEAKFEYEIQIDGTPGVSEITFTVDGQKVTYRNGPQSWAPMVWPGAEGDPGASIRAKGLGKNGEVTRKGEWGLWRLLALATVSGSAGQRVYSIKWDLSDQQVGIVTVRLRPKRTETPLFGVPSRGTKKYLGMFTSLRVPKSVVSGYACSAGPAEGEA